jgi:hypothetical protein
MTLKIVDQPKNNEHTDDCGDPKCQQCCNHDEVHYHQCVDCEKEFDPGAAIDRAMDFYEGER